jgi:peptide-methionine (R)-S-oxide reductase
MFMAMSAPSQFDLALLSPSDRLLLESGLDAEERRVLLNHGTEAPFCGGLLAEKRPGLYACRLCGLPLFRAQAKFDSGTGWPSFTTPWHPDHVTGVRDTSHGMERVETRCARCDSHQGHVFRDGPPPARMRYCINSVSLSFVADDTPLPDPLKRGDEAARRDTA